MKSALRLFTRLSAILLVCGAAELRAVNNAPVAIAGGPYTIIGGGSVVLNGASSNDPDIGDTLTYSWRINSAFGDLTGAQPVLSASAFSLGAGTYTIYLQVTDAAGLASTATATLTVVSAPHFSFYDPLAGRGDWAAVPYAPPVQASDGRFYGATPQGGFYNQGTIYRIDADGTGFVVLRSLSSATDGDSPQAGLVQGSDGKLYGTTQQGGSNGCGTIFSIAPDGTSFTVLRSLSSTDGANPHAGLVQANNGKLYGTTSQGGSNGYGTIFSIAPDGTGFTVLRSLSPTDGKPQAGLVQANNGKLYGTTSQPGSNGTIFSIAPDGTGFTVLRSLSSTDGTNPQAGLVQANDGKLYGTTSQGGNYGYGTIFSIATDGTGYTVLRTLRYATDGGLLYAGLVQANDGKLYGTTSQGGSTGYGTIFSIATDGTGFTVLRSLSSTTDGRYLYAGLMQANNGKLYGATTSGGSNDGGTIFSITTDGTDFTVLRSFSFATVGRNPDAGLVQATNGKLYGTTINGGSNRVGTIFSIAPDGTSFTVLRSLTAATDGFSPVATLVQATNGTLYGTMSQDGDYGYGTIFSIAADGTGFRVLRSLGSGTDGRNPRAGLVQATNGKLYGTTYGGGSNNIGTIFSIATDGTGFTVLCSLYFTDGYYPRAGLVQATNGKLYGTTSQGGTNGVGTIFSIAPDGTGFTVLRALSSGTDGDSPYAGLVQATNGKLYGTTSQGGTNNTGTIFSIATDGTGFTVLRSLTAATDGYSPVATLVQATNGKLYGTTQQGGSNGYGTMFSIAPDGTGFTVLRSLGSGTDGRNPKSGLMKANDGKLYGTTSNGGSNGSGTIFSYSNQAPVAAFTVTPNPGTLNTSVAFDGSASSDPEGDALATYAWNFGDGSSVSGASATASHTYPTAGTYAATLTVTDSLGATGTATTVNVVVNKLSQTLTFGTLADKTYGDAAFTVSATASSGLTPTYSIVSGPATISSGTFTLTGAGTVVVRASQAGNATYNAATPVDQSFSVGKATATVTLGSLSATYNGSAKSATATTTPGSLTVGFTYNGSATAPTNAGSYAVVGTISDTNYQGSASGTLVIGKATPSITWSTPSAITYGTALSASQLNASSGGVAGTFTYSPASGTTLNAGTQTLSVGFVPTDTTNYNSVGATTVSLTVNKATPTITWTTPSAITYGTALSATQLNASSGGVAGTFTYSPASGTTLNAGTQTLSVGFVPTDTGNYNSVAATTVSLTVNKATPTITWSTPSAITYGTALSSTQLNASSGGVAGAFTYTPASGTTLNAGTQTLSVGFVPTDTTNYNSVAATTVSLTVNKAGLTVTADAKNRAYGAANPTLTATITGFVNSDTVAVVSGSATLGTTATPTSTVGNYPITVTAGTLSASNYSFPTLTPGTLTVAKAPLTVTADAKTRAYGDANPTLTATITGYVNSETAAVVSGTPALSTSATATSSVGGYAINAALGTLTATNYSFGFASGTLTVGKAGLTVTADAKTKTYGAANPTLTATITGFKNSETTAILTGAPALATTATTASGVNSYPITAAVGTLAATNYSFAFVDGALAVTKAPLTVTADNKNRAFGAADPAFTATLTGFVNGDTVAAVTGTAAFTTTATGTSPAGTYPITPALGTLSATNYAFTTFTAGTLTVGQVAQTITFGALAGKTYGDAPFSVSATASSGLTPSYSILSGPATISSNTVTLTGAGTVVVRASQAGDANFLAATPVDQSFTVAKKTLTVTADAKTRAYGDANPTFTATLTGFVNGDTASLVSGAPALSTGATASSGAGAYAITAALGTLTATNYDFGFAVGTLTVVPAGQTITFPVIPDQSLVIGALTPPATASSGLAPVLALVSGPATISGGTITLTGAGTVVVRATQPGNLNYTAATPVDRAFAVLPATATVTLGNLAATYDGSAKAATATTVPGGLTVALTYNGSPTAPTNAGSYTVLATVTAANYTGSATGTLVIAPASQAITLGAIANKTFGDAAFTVSATTSSGLAPAYSILSGPATISGTTVTLTGAGTVVVRASQAGDTNYTAANPADQSFSVAPATATVSLGNLAQTADGTPKSVTVTTAPVGLAVNVTYNGGPAPSAAGTYAVVATITAANYTGTATGTLVLAAAATKPVITTQPASLTVTAGGTARFTVVATGNPAPAYQWRKNGTAIPNATGATLTLTNVQPADATSYDVVVSNPAGAVTSTAALLAVSPTNFAGTYFGTLGSDGTFALYLRPDNTGTFLAFAKGARTAYLSRAVTVDSQGRFSFTTTVTSATNAAGDRLPTADSAPTSAAAEAVFTGTIAPDGTLSGLGAGLVLTAQKSPETGASAAVAGFYETSAAGSSAQTLVIASPSGQAFALALTPTGPDAGTGTVSASGQIAVTTAAGQAVAATVAPAAATVSVTVTDNKGGTTVFTGLADNAAALAAQRLINLSSRVRTAAGDQVAIAGFVIGGDQPKRVLVRAVGPALAQFGVAGALAAPKLDLYRGSTVIATNTAWGSATNAADIAAAAAGAGAFALGAGSADSAVLTTLAPGAYTAIASSATGATGVALVEVYDLTAAVVGQKLVNLSTRALAGTASETLIAGVVVGGTVPKRVLIRAAGPALAAFGVSGALVRPKLELFSDSTVIAQNTGWSTSADTTGIAQAATQVGAFAFPAASADSAILINLAPGAYTAQVSGVGGTTGVALVEVYEVP